MIIMATVVIVSLCLAGAVVAFLLTEGESKEGKWPATEERLSEQRPYAHVEQGPDSLNPLSRGSVVKETEITREEG